MISSFASISQNYAFILRIWLALLYNIQRVYADVDFADFCGGRSPTDILSIAPLGDVRRAVAEQRADHRHRQSTVEGGDGKGVAKHMSMWQEDLR